MQVTFLIRSLNYGGSERQLVALATALRNQGMATAVTTFYPSGPLRKELETAGVPVFSLGKRSRWELFGFVGRLIRVIRQQQPAILHSYLGTANILAVLVWPLNPGTKVVWGVRASNMELERYGWLDRVLYWIECKLSRFADLIIVNAYAGLEYAAAHGFPRDKMVVIPNGIDVDRFCPDHESRKRMRQEWGVAETEHLIGLVGRLDPMKGHDVFLKGAAILMKERMDVRFVCVGGRAERHSRNLLTLSEALGLSDKLRWVHSIENVVAIYNALDVVTSSSIYGEGFSNVVGEAMACGIPCVVTDVGDSKVIVGDTGLVVSAGNPQVLAAAWNQLIEEGATSMAERGVRARERIMRHFSLERLVEDTVKVLQPLSD